MNNIKEKYIKLLSYYNKKNIDETIILFVFNLILLENVSVKNNFLELLNNSILNLSNFSFDENSLFNADAELKKLLENQSIPYKFFDLLTYIDYNMLPEFELNVFAKLPDIVQYNENLYNTLYHSLLAFLGENAITTLEMLEEYLSNI